MNIIDALIAAINAAIKTNGSKAITGAILQTVLDGIVTSLTGTVGLINVNKINNKADIYSSASAARNAVPVNLRAEGLVIAYKIDSGWVIEQNLNDSGMWTADECWQAAGGGGAAGTLEILESSITDETLRVWSSKTLNDWFSDKALDVKETTEDGLFVTDPYGNAIFEITNDGVNFYNMISYNL